MLNSPTPVPIYIYIYISNIYIQFICATSESITAKNESHDEGSCYRET